MRYDTDALLVCAYLWQIFPRSIKNVRRVLKFWYFLLYPKDLHFIPPFFVFVGVSITYSSHQFYFAILSRINFPVACAVNVKNHVIFFFLIICLLCILYTFNTDSSNSSGFLDNRFQAFQTYLIFNDDKIMFCFLFQ